MKIHPVTIASFALLLAMAPSLHASRASDLATEALKMIRIEHRAIESNQPLQGQEAVADKLFQAALGLDQACIQRYAETGAGDCVAPLDQFLVAARKLPMPVDAGDPASAILRALKATPAFDQADNPLIIGYQAAYLLNMEELRDATTMQQLSRFLSALDCPLTFKDLGLDKLGDAGIRELAARAMKEASGKRFYKTELFNFYITLVRLDSWGARDKGQRSGETVAADMMQADPTYFEKLAPGLSALRPMTIVFFGDSQTDYRHWSASAHYPEIVQAVFRRYNPGIKVINAGVGGDDTGEALARMDRDVITHKPGICFVLFGGNDAGHWGDPDPAVKPAAFIRNMAEIVNKLQGIDCLPVLMTDNPTPDARKNRPDDFRVLLKHIDSTETIARLLDLDLLHTRDAMEDPGGPPTYAVDNIHPNQVGQERLARLALTFLSRCGRDAPALSEADR